MRQVAVFNNKINQLSQGAVYADPVSIRTFFLDDKQITCGLLSCRDTRFDPDKAENANQVLVRKQAFSCNYRDRALVRMAQQKIEQLAQQKQGRFYTLGSEFTGEVVALGSQVKSLNIGDRVIGNGNYPYTDYPDARPGLATNHGSKELESFHFSKLVAIPGSVPVEVAASIPISGQTVYSMIRRLNLEAGEKVLVTAATSNTSLAAISALKHQPVKVYAVTTRAAFTDRLKDLGADEVFVVKRGLKTLLEDSAVLEFVKRNGLFDAVIDPFFDIYLSQVVDTMNLGGRYITCGLFHQAGLEEMAIENNASYPQLLHIMTNVMSKNLQIIGNCIGHTSDLERAVGDYMNGKFEVVIDSIYENNDVANFFERSFNEGDRFGKVVFKY